MRRILLYVCILLFGVISGGGVGWLLKPDNPQGGSAQVETDIPDTPKEYVKFPNDFVIPLLEHGRVSGMMVLRLSLEVGQGETEAVFKLEPKLRDEVLTVLFEHANAGGFKGTFTEAGNLHLLRRALLEASQKTAGPLVRDVLITDIARQDS